MTRAATLCQTCVCVCVCVINMIDITPTYSAAIHSKHMFHINRGALWGKRKERFRDTGNKTQKTLPRLNSLCISVFTFECKESVWNKRNESREVGRAAARGLLSERCHAALPHMAGLLLWSWVDISLITNYCSAPIRGIQTSALAGRPPLDPSIFKSQTEGGGITLQYT